MKDPKQKYTRVQLVLDTERDRRLIAWLRLQSNKCEYIRKLIEQDMPKEGADAVRVLS